MATVCLRGEAMVGDEIQNAIGTPPGLIGRNSSDEAGAVFVERGSAGQTNTRTGQSPANNNPAQAKRLRKRLPIGALAALLLAIAAVFGVPWVKEALNTVSTDDAYVNGHVTFVAARVPGQVSRVLVDDNNRVRTGDLLVELDGEPYEVIVAIKRAAVDTAKADLAATMAAVRGVEARTRALRWKLQHAIEDVENQIKLLHTKIAELDKSKARLKLARCSGADIYGSARHHNRGRRAALYRRRIV